MRMKTEAEQTAAGEKALRILRAYGDPARYEMMVQTLVRGYAGDVDADEDGVSVYSRPARTTMLAWRTPQRLEQMLSRIPAGASDIALHGEPGEETLQSVRARFGIANTLNIWQYAYYGPMPEPEPGFDIRPLGLDALDFVARNYGHMSREYIRERLEAGVMLGAYAGGEIAGFIGEHSEGSMGLLHVMPEHRRRHIGRALERAAIRRTMLRGYTPFGQVFEGNEASHALQERLCMTRSKGRIFWLTNDAM